MAASHGSIVYSEHASCVLQTGEFVKIQHIKGQFPETHPVFGRDAHGNILQNEARTSRLWHTARLLRETISDLVTKPTAGCCNSQILRNPFSEISEDLSGRADGRKQPVELLDTYRYAKASARSCGPARPRPARQWAVSSPTPL